MKFKFIFLLFLLFSTLTVAQIRKYTAHSVSSRSNSGSSWTKWSTPEEVSILISANADDNKIKIYSKVTQVYDIITYNEKEIDQDGDEIFKMYSEDAKGLNCNLDFVVLKSQNSQLQLYVRYSDLELVYNITQH